MAGLVDRRTPPRVHDGSRRSHHRRRHFAIHSSKHLGLLATSSPKGTRKPGELSSSHHLRKSMTVQPSRMRSVFEKQVRDVVAVSNHDSWEPSFSGICMIARTQTITLGGLVAHPQKPRRQMAKFTSPRLCLALLLDAVLAAAGTTSLPCSLPWTTWASTWPPQFTPRTAF